MVFFLGAYGRYLVGATRPDLEYSSGWWSRDCCTSGEKRSGLPRLLPRIDFLSGLRRGTRRDAGDFYDEKSVKATFDSNSVTCGIYLRVNAGIADRVWIGWEQIKTASIQLESHFSLRMRMISSLS